METKLKPHTGLIKPAKKAYQTPKLKGLGSVEKLTLKLGSNVDGMGGFA